MKIHSICIIIAVLGFCSAASASVTPLVVSTQFHNDNWFPLPVEQMKSAAVDTALTRISETGQFAFLYAAAGQLAARTGSLDLEVSLVEPAESAKIFIRLSLPDNQGTYVSTASASLHGKDYQGIFAAFQQLGIEGAEQITASLKNLTAKTGSAADQDIRNQIIDLNLHVIKLGSEISQYQQNSHDQEIVAQLGKLDTIIDRLDAQQDYAKQSDRVKNQKLDAIYSEIKKLNIGSNTDNRPPSSEELSAYDIAQLPKLKQAREFKFDKQFNEARAILVKMADDNKLSPGFRAAIVEELNINLALYEAEIVKNDVSGLFMRYLKNDEYKRKLAHVNKLYDSVLAQKDLALKTRLAVNQKKDELNLTGDSMETASMAMRNASLENMRMALRSALARHNTMRAMRIKGSGDGDCPNQETIDRLMKQARLSDPVVAYTSHEQSCELVLEESRDKLVVFSFSEEDTSYEHRQR